MSSINFKIIKKAVSRDIRAKGRNSRTLEQSGRPLARAGILQTAHGEIKTPAFVVVGTKATVKSLTPEQVSALGAEVVLANTYHLHLQPGADRIMVAGGLNKFMNWNGPTMTDSGGFQVFSLGAAFGKNITKITEDRDPDILLEEFTETTRKTRGQIVKNFEPAKIKEDGVYFRSHIDGSPHYFTPEKSIEIQNKIGADIIFAFDECTSPNESIHYQREALDRTHRWAKKSLQYHRSPENPLHDVAARQAIFGIVQGGRHEELRKKSAEIIGALDFDGFGIGGSFQKSDMQNAVRWVNEILPEEKPRHLLGIGEPADLFNAVENGCDLFDCVAPTRIGRTGQIYTSRGKINLRGTEFQNDFSAPDCDTTGKRICDCYSCQNYTRAYLAHLFRADEMTAATLASIHNLYFIVNLVKEMRQAIIEDNFFEFKENFLSNYKS